MGSRETVTIDYRFRGGWHIFTSNDMPGLFVARRDKDQARREVSVALGRMCELAGYGAPPEPRFTDTEQSQEGRAYAT